MTRFKRNTVLFLCGGTAYGLLELLWRGYTHWSMLLAGGLCFTLFSRIAERFRRRSLLYKASLGAAVVTAVEFVFGVICNLIFKMNVWDYSRVPLNVLGQICPRYTALWGVLSCAALPVADRMNRALKKRT